MSRDTTPPLSIIMKKQKKFLLLDPHYLPKRKTSSFGDWVSEKEISEGSLYAQMFFYYKPMED